MFGLELLLPWKNSNCLAACCKIEKGGSAECYMFRTCQESLCPTNVRVSLCQERYGNKTYQIVTTHYSDITFKGWPTCKITSPIGIWIICITEDAFLINYKIWRKKKKTELGTKMTISNSREEIFSFERPFFFCCIFCISVHGRS